MEMKQTEIAEQLSIIWSPHPVTPVVDRQSILWTAQEGQTVRELLLAANVDPYQPIVVSLDGRLLTVEEWDIVCPSAGQLVSVSATMQGGEGSNPLQVVAMIALIVVATVAFGPAGTFAATYGTTAAAIASAVVMVAGSLLIGAMFPPTGMNAAEAYEQASPTYSLTGGQNRIRPYESMPVVMGTHRVVFDYASRPYSEYKGEDQYLYQIFHGGVSPTRYTDYKIGTTPLTSYNDYQLFFASATGALPEFPGNVDSTAGAPLTAAAGWINRTTSINTYQIGIDVEAILFEANDEGGLDKTTVSLEIEYKATSSETWLAPSQIISSDVGVVVGAYQTITYDENQGYFESNWVGGEYGSGEWVDNIVSVTKTVFVAGAGGTVELEGNTQKPRRASLTFAVPQGEYDVRVRRTTADSVDAKLTQNTNWSVLKSYQVDDSNYLGQTRIGMTIRASEQLNGTISQFSALGTSDAVYWNGTAIVTGQTDNPAHLYTHFALGLYNSGGKLMYGVGLPLAQLDLPALHAWAQFCDTEGLTFNAVLDGNQTAADVLSAIARCGFGSPTWASGKLGVVWDYPNATAVASFGMSNIIRDTFEVSYINEQLAEEVVVRYRNPAKDWEQDEVRVLAPNVTDPLRTSAVDLFGCTDTDMAGKFANYLAAQQYYRRRRIVWESDFEGFVCQRGDVVLLSHDLTQWGYSGRIVAVQGLTLTLDREVPRNGSLEYLMITEPDGTMTTYNVIAGTGESNQVTLQNFPNFQSGYSLMDHRWSFSPLATPGKKVKIISIDPVSESRIRVVATDEFSEFYTAWGGTFNEPPDLSLLPSPIVEANNLTIVNRVAIVNGYRTNRITASWGVGGGVLYSRVRAYFDGNLVAEVAEALVSSFEYDSPQSGTFSIEVTPFGIFGAGATITSTLGVGSLEAPQPPLSVTLTVGEDGKAATYTWDSVSGVQSYVIEVVVSGTPVRTANVGNATSYTYTLDDAIADGGPYRAYTFRVYSVANSIQSLTYASAAFSNPQIAQLANVSLTPMPLSLTLRYDLPTDADFAGVMVWLSTDTNFTPSSSTLIYDGRENYVSIENTPDGLALEKSTTYFVYAAGYDTYGKDSLALSAKLFGSITSINWELIESLVTEDVLSLGLNERIDLIDTTNILDIDSLLIPPQDGLISKIRNLSTEVVDLNASADEIGEKLLESALKIQENTDLLYDAGVTVDSTTGEVYIFGVRENANELNEVDIRLSAAEANITLRATTTYVDEQIATAVIDPSQIVELGALTARVTSAEVEIDGLEAAVTLKADLLTVNNQDIRLSAAEVDIDALEGQIVLKASNTDLSATDARVSTVETTLNTLDIPSITQTVQDVRYINKNQEEIATTQLRDILTGNTNYTTLDTNIARAESSLTAYVDENISAEAAQRLILEVQLGETAAALSAESVARATADSAEAAERVALAAVVADNTALIESETLARSTADSALSSQITTLQATTASNTALITSETTARTNADSALSSQIVTLSATVDGNIAAITSEATTRATADSALSSQISTLNSTVSGNTAAIQTEATTRANADSALSTQITTLTSTVSGNTAAIQSEATTRANADSALSTTISTLTSTVNSNTAAIQSEATTRANADSALSSSLSTVQTTVGGHTTSIQTNSTSIDGIQGKYSVKIDNNGYVSGYGLISTANNGTPTSAFTILADRFSIASPVSTSPTDNLSVPFFVLTTTTTIEGKSFAPGVYIKKGNISTLNADSITTGYLNANRIDANTITAEKIDSRNLTIKDGSGDIIFGSGTNLDWARIAGQPSNIYNSNITISANGTLNGGGGGTVSLPGLGAGAFATLNQITTGNVSTYIGSAAIGDAYIGSLNATKINAGFIDAARIQVGSIDARIATIQQGQIADLAVNSAKIAGTLQSDNYSSTAGWQINKSGTMFLNQANVRGEVNVGAYTGGYNWPPAGGNGVHISANGILVGNLNGGGKYFQISTPQDGGQASIFTNIPAYLEDLQVGTLKIANSAVATGKIATNAVTNTAGVASTGTSSVSLQSEGGLLNIIVQLDQSASTNGDQRLLIYINGGLAEIVEGTQVVIGNTGGDAGSDIYGFSQAVRVRNWAVGAGVTGVTFYSMGGRYYTGIAMITQR